MWHEIKIRGGFLESAIESGDILRKMADRLTVELLAVHSQVAALRAAGVLGPTDSDPHRDVRSARSRWDGKPVSE
jgi:hypothetical protein